MDTMQISIQKNHDQVGLTPLQDDAPSLSTALRARHRLFAEMYLKTFNSFEAAKLAGYERWHKDEKKLRIVARDLLTRSDVKEYIEQRLEAELDSEGFSKGAVLRELCRISFFDPRKLFDEDGKLRPISELDDATAAAVNGVKVTETSSDDEVSVTTELKIISKKDTLELLGKRLGMFEKDSAGGNNFIFGAGSSPQFNVAFVTPQKK